MRCCLLGLLVLLVTTVTNIKSTAFVTAPIIKRCSLPLRQSTEEETNGDAQLDEEASRTIQWELLNKHHRGTFRGIWTTYDYMGDVQLETIASVDSVWNEEDDSIQVTHHIVQDATTSDCETCFDSANIRSIPIAQYTKDNLESRKVRLGANGMVIGPSLLKSGAMATELVLRYQDGRVRIIFQHAPVWNTGNSDSVGPPDGLKLVRVMVCTEAQRDSPPTQTSEESVQPPNPVFTRPTPPFDWHKQWVGTSWTWGVDSGDRGWQIEIDDSSDDAWHGSAPVEFWNLRKGTIFVQSPRILTNTAVLRVAWLATPETMLRLEAGVQVLQPLVEDDEVIGFAPPTLATLRCDVLQNMGDLEGEPSFVKQQREELFENPPETVSTSAKPLQVRDDGNDDNDDKTDSGLDAIRNALQL